MVHLLEKRLEQANSREMSNPEMNAVQNWMVSVQGKMINYATDRFVENYDAIMAGEFKGELLSGGSVGYLAGILGDIAYRDAFTTNTIYKLEIAAQTNMYFLLERFVGAAMVFETDIKMTSVQQRLMSLISDNYKAIYRIYSKDKSETEKLYLRLLLVTDSICGMTDSYAKRLYQELSGIIA